MRQVDRHDGRPDDEELLPLSDQLSALGEYGLSEDSIAQPLAALAIAEGPAHGEHTAHHGRLAALGAAQREAKRIALGLGAEVLDVQHLHILGHGAVERLEAVGTACDLEALGADPLLEIEATAVSGELRCACPVQLEEAPDLVAAVGRLGATTVAAALPPADEGAVHQRLCLLGLTCEEQLTDLGQMLGRLGIERRRVDAAAPHGALVERDALVLHAPIGEHPQATIA